MMGFNGEGHYALKKQFHCNSLICENFVCFYFPLGVLMGSSGSGNVLVQCSYTFELLVHSLVALTASKAA